MNRKKTILTLGAVAAVAVIGAATIPAIAGGGPWGTGHMTGHSRMDHSAMGEAGDHRPMGMAGFAENPVFQSFDADADGKVTEAEAEAGVTALLTTHDADKTGTLSEAEFGALFAEMTASMAARPFAMLDDDGDKAISTEEMAFPVKMMARMGRLTDVTTTQPSQP